MEITISAKKMQELIKQSESNADNKDYSFISTPRGKELVNCLLIMEEMGVRHIEVDLSEDDQSLLH
jgi:hypothetical protein